MHSVPRSISVLAIAALLAPPLLAAGDDHVPYHGTTALDVNSQAAIDAGMLALQAYDSVAHAELQAAVDSAAVNINEYTGTNRMGTKGASDGNTVSVRINDGASAEMIGVRLRHEWDHWKHGQAYGPYNGGVLFACGHFQAYADTYDHIAYVSCEHPGAVTCNQALNAIMKMQEFYLKCVESGGNPVWPVNPPDLCCD